MTEQNYRYRTDPLFLRNGFANTGRYGIPIIPKPAISCDELEDIRLIGFDKVKSDQGHHQQRIVHFFLYDYKFEQVWEKPNQFLESLQPYKAVLTPDYSIYTEMPEALQLYNIFRNRWCGAYFAGQGLRVIPTVNFGLESSFDFAFEGIEKGSAVAVSTYMVQTKEGREAQKEFFLAGYSEMLRCIEPEVILCYHEPFPEMQGNIIPIDYELSSWRHMDNDAEKPPQKDKQMNPSKGRFVRKTGWIAREAEISPVQQAGKAEANSSGQSYRIVKYGGYVVQLGSGSAFGGPWKPSKPEDERLLGKPGEIKRHGDKETHIGPDGRADRERHYNDAPNPNYHTNPHDHEIDWSTGRPSFGPAKNYPEDMYPGGAPTFKSKEGRSMELDINKIYKGISNEELESNRFKTIGEFSMSLINGNEINFIYENKIYGIFSPEKDVYIISNLQDDGSELRTDKTDDILNYNIGSHRLREIITQVDIVYRTI